MKTIRAQLRKWTTPIHWLFGALCAYSILAFGLLAGWVGMLAFALLELWNDKEEKANDPLYKPCGCTDWWESFIIFITGHGVLALLSYIGIVTIAWLM